MSCNTLKSILKSCNGGVGGIAKFYINNADSIDQSAVSKDDGLVDDIALDSQASDFVEFQFNPETSQYTENTVIDIQTGTTVYEWEITLVLNRREAAKRDKLILISAGQPELTTIIKDNNGIHWIFGLDDGKVFLTNNDSGSGQAMTDHNGYTLTFAGKSATPAYEIVEGLIKSELMNS